MNFLKEYIKKLDECSNSSTSIDSYEGITKNKIKPELRFNKQTDKQLSAKNKVKQIITK